MLNQMITKLKKNQNKLCMTGAFFKKAIKNSKIKAKQILKEYISLFIIYNNSNKS